MIKHLFYKEWIKTRFYAFMALIIGLGVSHYIVTTVQISINNSSSVNFILGSLYGEPQNIFYGVYKLVPFLTALAIGLSQFIPEVLEKRIKLTLHLPMQVNKLVYLMVLFGFLLYTIVMGISFAYFQYYNLTLFPSNMSMPITYSILVWIIGGMTTYFLIAMIAFEPNLLAKFLYTVFSYYLVRFYLLGHSHGETQSMLPSLLIIMATTSVAVFYSSHRFNKGEL
jgi:hypothetical protein